MIGRTLSHYRVTAKLGAGGMGEVYRATDSKLGRDVALKVLPEAFAADAQRMARFQREAQVLASLNHPNIATIHGLEESGAARALVMELVEGATLAARIVAGAIPLEEALPIAKQIAEALEYAHEKGVIHRDLKPANIKLTPDGKVKVLDFGLAKALQGDTTLLDASNSPTVSMAATKAGIILGTAAYMSPEQAKGKAVDRRADIWSFGVVLYEMLTGRQMFSGETATDILAAVVRAEPDWTLLPQEVPQRIRELLRRCLTKDEKRRLRDIGEARIEIDSLGREPSTADTKPTPVASGLSRAAWWLALGGLAVGVLLSGIAFRWAQPSSRSPDGAPPPLLRTTVELAAEGPLALGGTTMSGFDPAGVALSPNGAYLAYRAKSSLGTILYLREMASGETRSVPGTEGAIHSFFSPDSQWIGFLTSDRVKKVPVRGGGATTLCEARTPILGWWPKEKEIFFTEDETSRLSRVSADGGSPDSVLDQGKIGRMSWADVLPDGKSVLAVTVRGIGGDYQDVYVVNSETLETKLLVQSAYGARYVLPGYLIFARAGNVMAVRFDADQKAVVGEAIPVAVGAAMESLFGQVHAAFSDNGVMAYLSGGDRSFGKLAWVDRKGAVEFLDAPPRVYGQIVLAPDGKNLAVQVGDVKNYIWIYDVLRREGRRLPSAESVGWPIWSPDGRQLAVHSTPLGKQPRTLFERDAETGADTIEPITLPGLRAIALSWSKRTGTLALSIIETTQRIGFLESKQRTVVSGFDGLFPSFSPDGRWIAYNSNQKTGASEVFIRSYPDGKVDKQVSMGGGMESLWVESGDLFFRNGNRWFSTRVSTVPELRWDPPRLVFDTDFIDTPGISYAVSPDGQRLLVVKRAEPSAAPLKLNIIVNWPEELKRHAPAGKN